jgi:purine-binding chemotaxis protein CheW
MNPHEKQILNQRARLLAQTKDTPSTEKSLMFVEFLLFPESYAIEASYVQEVFSLKELTPIPGTPEHIMGVINFRGSIISVLNLKILFGLKEQGLTEMNKVILLRKQQMEFGLISDAITGLVNIPASKISSPPLNKGVILLDAARMLESNKLIISD